MKNLITLAALIIMACQSGHAQLNIEEKKDLIQEFTAF